MTTYRVILANTVSEGNAYAREQGWRPGEFRVAPRAAAIRGLRDAEVHELPSFDRRMDRFAIHSELRYNRGPHFRIDDGWTWQGINTAPEQPELPFDTSTTTAGNGTVPSTTESTDSEVLEAAQKSTKVGAMAPDPLPAQTAAAEATEPAARELLSEPTPKRPRRPSTAVDRKGTHRPVTDVLTDL